MELLFQIMIKKYIIVILVVLFCVIITINQIRYDRLKKEFNSLKLSYPVENDSLKTQNILLSAKIITLEDSMKLFSRQIDSLKVVKKTIIINRTFEESKNLSEGVNKLKQYLQCEKY